jgi:hyperosmotically inducible periplasmic protein
MVQVPRSFSKVFVMVTSLVFCANVLASARAPQESQQTQPDNTKKNRDQAPPTADQQKQNDSDRTITQKIRKSIMADKSLSTDAHNIKIVSQDGKVTLRGPVRSEDERNTVQAKASEVAGENNVTCLVDVAPSK